MGLVVFDELDTGMGFTLTQTYVSFHNEEVRITPLSGADGKRYMLSSSYIVYKSKAAMDSGASPIKRVGFSTTTTSVKDVFATLYSSLKLEFQHSEDAA